jgi:hypothetical protein
LAASEDRVAALQNEERQRLDERERLVAETERAQNDRRRVQRRSVRLLTGFALLVLASGRLHTQTLQVDHCPQSVAAVEYPCNLIEPIVGLRGDVAFASSVGQLGGLRHSSYGRLHIAGR